MERTSENQDVLEIQLATRRGSQGCAFLFLFLALAILVPVGLGLLGIIKAGHSRWVFLVYSPFILVLLWIAKRVYSDLSLQKVSIDRENRTFSEHYGAGTGKTSVMARDFDDLSAVLLGSRTRHSRKGGSTTYYEVEVRFRNPDTQESGVTRVGSFSEDYFRGRELAEQVAKFCRLPLEDTAMGNEAVVRAPEDLGLSLKEKGRKAWPARPAIARPPDARSVIRDRGDRIEIMFPLYKLQVGCFISLAFVGVWLGFTGNFLLSLLSSSGGMAPDAEAFEFAIALILFAVPALLTAFFLILAKGRRQKLIIRPESVEHEMYRILPRKRVVLPRESIEEVVMGSGTLMDQGPFIIRGDRSQIVIENTVLSKVEREYLRSFIESQLSR